MAKLVKHGKRYIKIYTSEEIQYRRAMGMCAHPWIPEIVRGVDLGIKCSNNVYNHRKDKEDENNGLGK